MTPKQEDQLLCDYFNSEDTIKVKCRWLQSKLHGQDAPLKLLKLMYTVYSQGAFSLTTGTTDFMV